MLFNYQFKALDVSSPRARTPSQPVYSSITKKKFMQQYSFKCYTVQNSILRFCQVAEQLLQQNNKDIFISAHNQLCGIYRLL